MSRLKKFLLSRAVAIGVALATQASAHDAWHDGTPVPEWVKGYCCGPADAHHYRFDEVKVTPAGYVLPDYPKPIPADDPTHVFKSEDGEYWAFFRDMVGRRALRGLLFVRATGDHVMLYALAAIGAYSVARWAWRNRHAGSALPKLLKPWGRRFL